MLAQQNILAKVRVASKLCFLKSCGRSGGWFSVSLRNVDTRSTNKGTWESSLHNVYYFRLCHRHYSCILLLWMLAKVLKKIWWNIVSAYKLLFMARLQPTCRLFIPVYCSEVLSLEMDQGCRIEGANQWNKLRYIVAAVETSQPSLPYNYLPETDIQGGFL